MSKSTPKAPDYTAAAEAQGQSSKEVTEQQSWANRPDQNTPWGQQSWNATPTWDPATKQYINKWEQTTTLNPDSQRALDAELGLQAGRSELGASLLPRAEQEFGQSMDWSKFQKMGDVVKGQQLTPEELQRGVKGEEYQRNLSTEGLTELDPSQKYQQNANDAIYNQWASRALPEQQRQSEQMRTRLYNMGLKEGDEAYDQEMQKLGQQQGDAMQQAQYQATIGSGAEAQRMLGMDAATRAQMFGERGQQGNFANQAAGQQFQQSLAQGSFGNEAAGQAFGMMSGAAGQNFAQDTASSNQQTQQRQQQIAEEMQKRGFSLNEINAIISGQQVAMPTMPGFNTASKANEVNYSGAAQSQGQAALDAYNAKQQAYQGMMSGIGSIAGGFMPG